MNADAIVMLVVAAGVIWGGLVASIVHLRRSTAYTDDQQ